MTDDHIPLTEVQRLQNDVAVAKFAAESSALHLGALVDELRDEAARYRAGNTELLEALMHVAAGTDPELTKALELLGRAGMLFGDGALDWAALEARKPKRQTWEQAVRECVTDQAEVERLLALGDDSIAEEVQAAVRGPVQGA